MLEKIVAEMKLDFKDKKVELQLKDNHIKGRYVREVVKYKKGHEGVNRRTNYWPPNDDEALEIYKEKVIEYSGK